MNKIETEIIKNKKILRDKSKNYKENFEKISNFIKSEILKIKQLQKKKKPIIPEINFDDILDHTQKDIEKIKKRGCVIVREVFKKEKINLWNKKLENYIETNNYYDDQKKKSHLDNYFSDLKSGKPQIFGLYWSKTQTEIRQSPELDKVKKFINNIWDYKFGDNQIFDPNKELIYADRVRRREPGDSTLGLSPHCDAGSVERWIEKNYQKIYHKIFSDEFDKYNPFNALYRDKTELIKSPAVSNTFRTFQGWTALTKQGPNDGTLQLIPIVKSMAYVLTRALMNDVPENELCGSKSGKALSINEKYHSLLLEGLVSIPKMEPGDTVWWHPDVIHAVENIHTGKNYSNVIYVGSMPYCAKNLAYAKIQAKKFLNGESPQDFASEDYEVNYKNRSLSNDLSDLGKKQMALKYWL